MSSLRACVCFRCRDLTKLLALWMLRPFPTPLGLQCIRLLCYGQPPRACVGRLCSSDALGTASPCTYWMLHSYPTRRWGLSVFSCSNVFSLHKCRSQMGSMGSHFGLSKAAQTGVQQHKMSSSLFRSHLEATSFL